MTQPPSYAWTTRHLPLFGGTEAEDPVLHCRSFHYVCCHIKPENETIEEFKVKCFKFSLTDFATIWYYASPAYSAVRFVDICAPFLKEFSPPSLRQETREKILNLQQSRDETLDEYYMNYDAIVSSCPHHGFSKKVLLQKFLRGMRSEELGRVNEAMRRSAENFTIASMWNLIIGLAAVTERIPQADEGMQTEEAGPKPDREETPEPSEETPEPSEESDMESTGSNEVGVQNTTDEPPNSYPTAITRGAETVCNQILTDKADPSLRMQASRLFPLINKQVARNYAIKEEAERRMGKGPMQNNPAMEQCYAITGQYSPKHKRLAVKGPSPARKSWKGNPEQWDQGPSTTPSKKSGKGKAKTNTGTVTKFDLSHPWDPNQ